MKVLKKCDGNSTVLRREGREKRLEKIVGKSAGKIEE